MRQGLHVAAVTVLALAVLAVAVLATVLRAWWVVVPAARIAVLVACGWLPTVRPAPASEHWDVQAMTMNLRYGQGDQGTVVAAVQQHGVDLLSVQELTGPAVAGLHDAGLDALLPYRYLRPGRTAEGTWMWSRYPIKQAQDTGDLVFENLAARISTPHGPLTFFAMHPIPPAPLDGRKANGSSRRCTTCCRLCRVRR